jgi:hypothetical protein
MSREGRYRTLRRHVIAPLLPGWSLRLVGAVRPRADPISDWLGYSLLRPELAADLDLPGLKPMLDERRRTPWRVQALAAVQTGAGQAEDAAALAALTGVEDRDPTVDRRVIQVAMRQPEWVRRHDGIRRAVVRGAMADRLPAEIVHRTRHGDQLPNWLDVLTARRQELVRELDELEQHPTSREIIDTARLGRLLGSWPDPAACADPVVIRDYRQALFRALVISRYVRWFERRAATPDALPAAVAR